MADIELLELPEKAVISTFPFTRVSICGYTADQMQAYARANVVHATAQLQAETDALRTRLEDTVRDSTNEIEALRDEFHNLRKRAETAWNRGYQQGLDANRLLATQATDARKKEREAHAETNRAMTNALLMMEAREQRDEALLRQALEALERGAWDTLSGRNAAFAIRERLGLGQGECKDAEG